ncbi:hypothetical protein SAMN05192549_103265 [Duganella sacchari]|uniref:HipA-like kinase domain-containing protein n=2 Tax=Duganella TaxID=75654 RepID=A0A1M7MPI9_9BURK|nr:HipA family kinase [Duganella sacchari]SHM92926.1 hypothetical protein SAMN05192549_103265 [Duganella sacchari]
MSLTVIEILGRSQEGQTQPYICRCDDGEVYFVKGRSANRDGLINEWISARLCTALHLPIAPYAIATVPEELIEADLAGQYSALGPGPVFASLRINATHLTRPNLRATPQQLRCDVLIFDWWIHNGDRNLTKLGGNPNLLWSLDTPRTLKMIDHNLAFDDQFDATAFFQMHVFSEETNQLFSDFLLRDSYRDRLAQALENWTDICDTLPEE